MTSLVIDLIVSYPVSKMIHASVPASTTTNITITTTLSLPPPPPPQPQQSTRDLMLLKRIGELGQHMADLIQDNLALEERLGNASSTSSRFRDLPTVDIKEILQQQMFEYNSYKAHDVHNDLYEALQKSLELDYSNQCASGAPGTSGASGSSQLPLPPPPSTGTLGSAQQQGSKAPSSSKTAASTHQSMAWTIFYTRYESTGFTAIQETSPSDDLMYDDSIPDEHVHLSDDEDSENNHLPKDNMKKDWWKPLPEEERLATPEPAWTIPSSNVSDVKNNWASALVSTYETLAENSLLAKTGDMTTFINYSRWRSVTRCSQIKLTRRIQKEIKYGKKGSSPALSISKMKAASYPNFGLELLVPEQMWIDDVCTYDISAKYGISHWWFTRQKFYIDRHDSLSRRKDVRTHMRILSVVRIKAYSRYKYDYLSHLDHLPGSDKRMLSTAIKLNLTKPGWDATGYELKHDYTIIKSPRAVMFPVDNNDLKITRFNEIYKFSDGMLTRILEALDYKVKEFKVKRLNPEHPSDTKVLTMKMEILQEPTSNKLLVVGFNSLVYSLRALSTLRHFGLRTASAAAKPCQGDSLEFYLITGSIYTD
ncbi:hypothetical protein Tco_0558309 [Tanacetum coccineum]